MNVLQNILFDVLTNQNINNYHIKISKILFIIGLVFSSKFEYRKKLNVLISSQ